MVEAAVLTHEPAAADSDLRVLGEDLEKSLQNAGRDMRIGIEREYVGRVPVADPGVRGPGEADVRT
jgi:hypothetical protein